MKKSILNLQGAQELSKNEQREINGGKAVICKTNFCVTNADCISFPGNVCNLKGCCDLPLDPSL